MNNENRESDATKYDECGHTVPETNMAIHHATHHHQNKPPTTATGNPPRADTDTIAPHDVAETITCENCGKDVPCANAVVHGATCRHNQSRARRDETDAPSLSGGHAVHVVDSDEGAYETVDEGISGRVVSAPPPTSAPPTPPSPDTSPPASSTPAELDYWACPRCTLHNPLRSRTCDACDYTNPTTTDDTPTENPQSLNNGDMHLRVIQADTSRVSGITSSALGWGIVGALFGGPVGALLGASAGAVAGGVASRRRPSNPTTARRPWVTFSSTTVRHTPYGSTVSVTSNASGQRRTVTMQSSSQGDELFRRIVEGGSPEDQRILQMLLINAVAQGAEDVDGLSYEELLARFGVGTERRRGASEETIESLDLRTLGEEELVGLTESQKCCNVCLEDFKEGDEVRQLDCCHAFHKKCIDRWISQVASCPICKKDIVKKEKGKERVNNDDSEVET